MPRASKSFNTASPNSIPNSGHIFGAASAAGAPLAIAPTTASMISFPTHNWATGSVDLHALMMSDALASPGLVSQTVRNNGGMFPSALQRSRHPFTSDFFGETGCISSGYFGCVTGAVRGAVAGALTRAGAGGAATGAGGQASIRHAMSQNMYS